MTPASFGTRHLPPFVTRHLASCPLGTCLVWHLPCLAVAEAKERADGMNAEEELLGQPKSIFEQLEAVPRILAPYVSLSPNNPKP